ncbi:MAG TPA: hypothetical protein VNQ56_06115 [Pseudolabrys sp.]|nr:hypothetical protein [Pseudolabrys sp.]
MSTVSRTSSPYSGLATQTGVTRTAVTPPVQASDHDTEQRGGRDHDREQRRRHEAQQSDGCGHLVDKII